MEPLPPDELYTPKPDTRRRKGRFNWQRRHEARQYDKFGWRYSYNGWGLGWEHSLWGKGAHPIYDEAHAKAHRYYLARAAYVTRHQFRRSEGYWQPKHLRRGKHRDRLNFFQY